MTHQNYILKTIELATENINQNKGGPFAAIIVQNDTIIGQGTNTVTSEKDPTCHAEMNAIRNACKNLDNFILENSVIYTSCEPCPMCLSAIYWARIKYIYFSNTREDAHNIGFSDDFIYNEINLSYNQRSIPIEQILIDNTMVPFQQWQSKTDKIEY